MKGLELGEGFVRKSARRVFRYLGGLTKKEG